MATAQVTIKAPLNEAQIITEALRMYLHVWRETDPVTGYTSGLEGFDHNLSIIDGQPRNAIRVASKLINDLGLK